MVNQLIGQRGSHQERGTAGASIATTSMTGSARKKSAGVVHPDAIMIPDKDEVWPGWKRHNLHWGEDGKVRLRPFTHPEGTVFIHHDVSGFRDIPYDAVVTRNGKVVWRGKGGK